VSALGAGASSGREISVGISHRCTIIGMPWDILRLQILVSYQM
jgi:hypothetical protein